ncbi:Crp/Fnr family transcriptional regulator [Novosphingobium sp. G106]|uniref:Crp/Fnr family transcriptional regulator n=1 Tax=Novosphingobium sp. G106 TaxID=2849500 RepID=UPI001C2D4690|nr:Crp/Fnr family transcriptional regulator [Novosphingobium sp. G106]MBV1690300.1 Crp/Fnr family transcriptional regulator [Novosphingobium sp. G106]
MTNRFIEKLRTFNALSSAGEAALVQATSRSRKMSGRRDLIREGDRPGPVFVMLDGWAYRYKILPSGTRQVLAYLMPGDCCDLHIGLLAEMDHSIQTITTAQVATIERGEMDAILDTHRSVANAMYIAQLVDEGTLRAWITSMGRRTSGERVAHLMCELYIRARNIGLISEATFTLPLSQLLLADSLGMTAVHLNRVLKRLKREGVMDLQRGRIIILDPAALAQIAGFDDNYLHRKLRAA